MGLLKKIFTLLNFKKYSRYYIISFIFITWITFLDSNSLITHRKLNKTIKNSIQSLDTLNRQIQSDSLQLYNLNNKSEIEKIARENFYMKKPNESIYIYIDSTKN